MLLGKMVAVGLLVVPLTGCAHENDARDAARREDARRAACPDVTKSQALAVERLADFDYEAVYAEMNCDGEISEAEDQCLRGSWARTAYGATAEDFGRSPELAVRATAGPETTITGFLERRPGWARVAIARDGATGVYEIQRMRRGWLVVTGVGCASGAAVEPFSLDDLSPACREAMEEATANADEGDFVGFSCIEDGSAEED
ncbi:hypothetical protein GCM10022237_31540 [Nocardioides ginsengisoli]